MAIIHSFFEVLDINTKRYKCKKCQRSCSGTNGSNLKQHLTQHKEEYEEFLKACKAAEEAPLATNQMLISFPKRVQPAATVSKRMQIIPIPNARSKRMFLFQDVSGNQLVQESAQEASRSTVDPLWSGDDGVDDTDAVVALVDADGAEGQNRTIRTSGKKRKVSGPGTTIKSSFGNMRDFSGENFKIANECLNYKACLLVPLQVEERTPKLSTEQLSK